MKDSPKNWKVFICHSSDDKEDFAEPLANLLKEKGTDIWYDAYSISQNDFIDSEIHKGLEESNGGIIILSNAFFKIRKEQREWLKIELYVLYHKRKINKGFLIPIFYNIQRDQIPIQFDILKNINGFDYKTDDKLNILASKINNRLKKIQEEELKIIKLKKKEDKKGDWKKWAYISIILLILPFCLIYYMLNLKNNDSLLTTHQRIRKSTIDSLNQETNYKKPIINHINTTSKFFLENNHNLSQYIANTHVKSVICIAVINENDRIETYISNEIAKICNEKWGKAQTGLFRSAFFKTSYYIELKDAKPDIITKLNLSEYTDLLFLGEIKYDTTIKGSLVENTFISKINLNANVISVKNKSIIEIIQISGKWNGVSESQAKEGALNNLLSNLKEQISLIK